MRIDIFDGSLRKTEKVYEKELLPPGGNLSEQDLRKWWHNRAVPQTRLNIKQALDFYGALNTQSLLASKLHEKQNKVSFGKYDLVEVATVGGTILGCKTKCFTTDKQELIPAIQVVGSAKKTYDLSEYEFFVQRCSDNGIDSIKIRAFMEYQIVTDFLLTNTDLHFNNFGVLRNTDTLKYVGMAPIFDSGNSMLWNCKKDTVCLRNFFLYPLKNCK